MATTPTKPAIDSGSVSFKGVSASASTGTILDEASNTTKVTVNIAVTIPPTDTKMRPEITFAPPGGFLPGTTWGYTTANPCAPTVNGFSCNVTAHPTGDCAALASFVPGDTGEYPTAGGSVADDGSAVFTQSIVIEDDGILDDCAVKNDIVTMLGNTSFTGFQVNVEANVCLLFNAVYYDTVGPLAIAQDCRTFGFTLLKSASVFSDIVSLNPSGLPFAFPKEVTVVPGGCGGDDKLVEITFQIVNLDATVIDTSIEGVATMAVPGTNFTQVPGQTDITLVSGCYADFDALLAALSGSGNTATMTADLSIEFKDKDGEAAIVTATPTFSVIRGQFEGSETLDLAPATRTMSSKDRGELLAADVYDATKLTSNETVFLAGRDELCAKVLLENPGEKDVMTSYDLAVTQVRACFFEESVDLASLSQKDEFGLSLGCGSTDAIEAEVVVVDETKVTGTEFETRFYSGATITGYISDGTTPYNSTFIELDDGAFKSASNVDVSSVCDAAMVCVKPSLGQFFKAAGRLEKRMVLVIDVSGVVAPFASDVRTQQCTAPGLTGRSFSGKNAKGRRASGAASSLASAVVSGEVLTTETESSSSSGNLALVLGITGGIVAALVLTLFGVYMFRRKNARMWKTGGYKAPYRRMVRNV